MQGGETHAYAISVELRAVLRAVLQPPARIGWTISVPAISNPSDPAVWPLWRIAIGRAKLLNVSAPGTLLGFSSTVWRISRHIHNVALSDANVSLESSRSSGWSLRYITEPSCEML